MDARYDASHVATAFDEYGEREWDRHEESVPARVAFLIHQRLLQTHVHSGATVLEVGAGPGRFTIELAQLGARITVADISPSQLALNASHVRRAGVEAAVERRQLADITDLSAFDTASFDAVVCYGAPLSFVMERADDAMAELVRVAQPGAVLLLGVASRFGTMRAFLRAVHEEIVEDSIEWTEAVVATGDLTSPHSSLGLPMHLFMWDELRTLVERHGCEVLEASAANFLSTGDPDACAEFASDPKLWERFLSWESAACKQPGGIDSGTQMIVVARRG